MDVNKKHILNKYHVLFLAQNTLIGLGLLTLSYDISQVKYNIWLIPFFLGIIVNTLLYFMVKLSSKYPNDNLFKINEKLLGKFIGKLLNVFIILYGTIMVSMVVEGYARSIQTLTLPNKTITLSVLVLVLTTVVITKGGIKSIARFCIISFFFTIWLTYFLRWSFINATWTHMFPIFDFSSQELFSSLRNGLKALLGLEGMLFYYPFIVQKEKAFKHATLGLWVTIIVYALTCLASAVTFNVWQLQHMKTPILAILKLVELSFIERIENLGLNLWVFLILSTTSLYLWIASKGIAYLTNKSQMWNVYLVSIFVILISLIQIEQQHREFIYDLTVYFGFFLNILPMLLLIIYKLRQKMVSKK